MIRQEIKFIIEKKIKIKNLIKKLKLKKLHEQRIVNSFYFDSVDNKFFNQSEEGLTPRMKVRIRNYNSEKEISFEIKTTNNYDRNKIVEKKQKYSKNNLDKFLNKNEVKTIIFPKLYVSYKRDYFTSKYGRITLDRDISYQKINLEMKKIGSVVLDYHTILEVKYDNNEYDKNKILSFIGCPETRNSKYCNGINLINFRKINFAL